MTFLELFNITKSKYPELDEDFEIILINDEKNGLDAQIIVPDKLATFSDTCFDGDICPNRPLIQFRVFKTSEFTISDDASCSTKDTAELLLNLSSSGLEIEDKMEGE